MVTHFKNNDEFKSHIKKIAVSNIGKGTEGQIWLTKDNDTIKYTLKEFRKPYSTSIITTETMQLDSFLFPTELFIVDDTVAGYRAPYFNGDIFNRMNEKAGRVINLENLSNARSKMIKDIEVLTKARYKIEDIENNLMFNGKKLSAIDTLEYHKVKNIEVYENVEALDYAIISRLVLIHPKVKRLRYSTFDEIVDYLADDDIFELVIPKQLIK